MSLVKVISIVSLILSLYIVSVAQKPKSTANSSAKIVSDQSNDEALALHLSAAETYQISGDLPNASTENRAIVGIVLQRIANLALTEGQYQRAIKLFNDSIAMSDQIQTRVDLAAAYLAASDTDRAIASAREVLQIDPKNITAHYFLGRLLYTRGDYAAALPELESTIINSPDFGSAYALGVTYLNLKFVDRAKLLFEEMQTPLKNNKNGLHILFGRAYEETGYYLDAEREFKLELANDPKTPKAHFFIGYTILQHGGSERLAEAGREFDAELSISPNDFYANFFRGVVATSESEHAKAIGYLQKAVKIKPLVAETYLFLGQSQIEIGDTAVAEKNLRRAIDLSPNIDKKDFQLRRSHFLLGRLLIKSGRKSEGEKELAKAKVIQGQMLSTARDEISKILNEVVGKENTIEIQKLNNGIEKRDTEKVILTPKRLAEINSLKGRFSEMLAQAYHNLGVIDAQQNETEKALQKFGAAAEWKPDFPGLDRNWGITSFRANQFDKAIAPLARHLKVRPDDLLVRRMLGVSYYLTKDYKQSAATLKPIETKLADDAELAYFYGISLVSLDRQAEASVVFANLATQNAKSAQARFYAGQGFVLIGNYEMAVSEFRSASTLDASTARAHYNAGQSLIRLNRLEEGESEFRKELISSPTDELSKYALAYTLVERKIRIDEAISLLREAIAIRYDYADARYQLGKALIEKGEIAEAIEHLEIAASSDPKKDYIHYQLGIAYRRVSRPIDSENSLKLFRELKEANRREKPSGMGNKVNAP